MGNASVKAHGHGYGHKHIHNNTRRHNKRFRRTRHKHRHNNGGGLNPDKSAVTRKKFNSRPGFHKSPGLERSVVLGEAHKAEAESKRLQSLKKVNAEGSKRLTKPKKQVAKMESLTEEEE